MLNKTILQGRLVKDPELSNTPSGVEVCKFTVAWSKKYKETESQCFLNCVAWRQTGVFVNKYFTKGQEIVVEGELTSRGYEDKNGNKRTAFELVCDQVHFCGSKSNNSADSASLASAPSFPTPESFVAPAKGTGFSVGDFEEIDTDDNDLPF